MVVYLLLMHDINILLISIDWILDGGYLPHAVLRMGIRYQLADRLNSLHTSSLEEHYRRKLAYISLLRSRPIALDIAPELHNKQHYEVGTGVMAAFMGPRIKYSACLYPTGRETLAQAENIMLET